VFGDRHNASIREHRLCKNKHDWIETDVELVLVMRYASLTHPTRSAIAYIEPVLVMRYASLTHPTRSAIALQPTIKTGCW
jgi:hypothetical protein